MADELDRREDRELEVIQRQMEQTRANLGNKLEALESHVVGTVNAATETVSDAVQGVKDVVGTVTESVAAVSTTVTETASAVSDTVSGTVASVADSLNIAKHIEAHPWGAMGAAFGIGFLGSLLLGSSEKKEQPSSSSGSSSGSWLPSATATGAPSSSFTAPATSSSTASTTSSWLGQGSPVGQLLNQATEGVTDLALNSIMGVVRELTASLPENFREPANKFVDSMATDLGVPHKVLAANPPVQPSSQTGAANGAPQQSRQSDNPAFNRSRASMSA